MREIEQRISRASAAVAGIIIRHALKTRREIPTGRQRRKKFQDREEGNKRRRGLSRFPPRRVFVLRITYPPRSSGGGGGGGTADVYMAVEKRSMGKPFAALKIGAGLFRFRVADG